MRYTKGPSLGKPEREQFFGDRLGEGRVPARGGIYRSGFVGWCVPRRSREFVLFMLIFPSWKILSIHTEKASNEFPSKPFPYSIYYLFQLMVASLCQPALAKWVWAKCIRARKSRVMERAIRTEPGILNAVKIVFFMGYPSPRLYLLAPGRNT